MRQTSFSESSSHGNQIPRTFIDCSVHCSAFSRNYEDQQKSMFQLAEVSQVKELEKRLESQRLEFEKSLESQRLKSSVRW